MRGRSRISSSRSASLIVVFVYCLGVVRSDSISSAGLRLSVNQTTVSRRITELETQLGKKMFDRKPNGWVLTSAGESIVKLTEQVGDKFYEISRKIDANSDDLRGVLRVTAVDICVEVMMLPAIIEFRSVYPDIEIELVTSTDTLDLASREADIALRATNDPPADLVGKKIGKLAYNVYGTKQFLDQQSPECITWVGDRFTRPAWIRKNYPTVRTPMRTNSALAMLNMTELGMGIAQLPCVLADSVAQLVPMPVTFVEPGSDLWVLSHIDLRTTARVRIFRDHLVRYLSERIDSIEGRTVQGRKPS